jgi:hypothetical protein
MVSISLLGGEDWSKLTRLQGRNAHGFVLELDGEQANLPRTHVLHRMRWQGLDPRDHGCYGRPRRGASIEQAFSLAVTADKIACAQRVTSAWRV